MKASMRNMSSCWNFHIRYISKLDRLVQTKYPDKFVKAFVLEFEQCKCNWCAFKLNDAKSLDHIIPRKNGGPNILFNYQYLCSFCHDIKNHIESETKYIALDHHTLVQHIKSSLRWDSKLPPELVEEKARTIVWSLQSPDGYVLSREKQMRNYFNQEKNTTTNKS
jgi:hypothetical protein